MHRARRAIAMDLPIEDPAAGPREYAETVAAALAGVDDPVVLVGHSLGGITIPNVAALRPVARLLYLCGLVPKPGVSWDAVEGELGPAGPSSDGETRPDGSYRISQADAVRQLYQECPADVAIAAARRLRFQAWGITELPSLDYPTVPAAYVLARHDLTLAPAWCRALARSRLGVDAVEIDGDHSPMLGRPAELADLLLALEER
jgi:pimeloyl-ACP methyl ester carboxylesterase